MKHYLKCKNILKTVCLVASIALSGSVSANLINGDFSAGTEGLNGWEGAVFDYSLGLAGEYETVDNFANYPSIYTTNSNSVELNTTFDIAEVYLFQDFTFDNDVSEFSLDFFHSDEQNTFDAFNIELTTTGGFYHNFVTDGLLVDISSLAGQAAHFEISFADLDLFDDTLTVSDISITSAPVPEPSSFALFALALFAFRQKTKSTANRFLKLN